MKQPLPKEIKIMEADLQLRTIYEDENGEIPNLKKLQHASGGDVSRVLLKLIGVLFVLSAAAWGGFFVWTRGMFDQKTPLALSIEGPDTVRAGEAVVYTFRFANRGKVPIGSLEAKINTPSGFLIEASVPPSTENNMWILPPLTARSDGAIEMKGSFRTEAGKAQTLQALFTYSPANYSSAFQELTSKRIEVAESVIKVDLSGPEKAVAGDLMTYTINVQNTSLQTVKDVQVDFVPPEHFAIKKAEPPSTSPDAARWIFTDLEPAEVYAIALTGVLSASATDEQTFVARAGFLEDATRVTEQARAQTMTDVLGGNFVFHLVLDGTSQDQTADPGETLLASVDYRNAGDDVLGDVKLNLTAQAADGKLLPFDAKKNPLTVPEVGTLIPGGEGSVDISIPLFETLDAAKYADAFTLKLTAEFSKVGSVETPRVLESTPITVAINSDVAAESSVKHAEGERPPKVGLASVYEISWKITNRLHELERVAMSAKLPPDVEWKNLQQASLGALTYDAATRIVSWRLESLPTDTTQVQASFHVGITPQASDVGSFFKLANATLLEATDKKTRALLTRALDVLTTADASADAAAGVVVE